MERRFYFGIFSVPNFPSCRLFLCASAGKRRRIWEFVNKSLKRKSERSERSDTAEQLQQQNFGRKARKIVNVSLATLDGPGSDGLHHLLSLVSIFFVSEDWSEVMTVE